MNKKDNELKRSYLVVYKFLTEKEKITGSVEIETKGKIYDLNKIKEGILEKHNNSKERISGLVILNIISLPI